MTSKYWVPKTIGLVILVSGIVNILSAFERRNWAMIWMERWVSLDIVDASRTLAILAGFFLMYLAYGVWKRKILAWWLSMIILVSSLILHLIKGFAWPEALALIVPLILLVIYKRQFVVFSSRDTFVSRLRMALALMLMMSVYASLGFFLLQGQFRQKVTVQTVIQDYKYTVLGVGQDTLIPRTRRALWFEESISIVGIFVWIVVFGSLFAPVGWLGPVNDDDWRQARKLIRRYGKHPTSFFGLMADKNYFFSLSRRCVVIYKIKAGTAVVLGDPIGEEQECKECLRQFFDAMMSRGVSVAFFQATPKMKQIYEDLGLKILQLGSDAIVDLRTFSLSGSEFKNLRNTVKHAMQYELYFRWYTMDTIPWNVMHRVDNLHKEWLKEKKIPSLTFSLGYYPFPPEEKGWILVVEDGDENIYTVLSFYPYNQEKGQVLDLMIRSSLAISGVMEAALVEGIKHFAALGVRELDLGFAAINLNLSENQVQPRISKGLDRLYYQFSQFYIYNSITKFKAKFNPHWEPRFLVYASEVELPKTVLALIQVHLQKTLWQYLWRKDYE